MLLRKLALALPIVLIACEEAPPPPEEPKPAEPQAGAAPVAPEPKAPEGPPAIAKLEKSVGTFTWTRGGDKLEGNAGAPVLEGDKFETAKDGKIRLTFTEGSILALGPESELTVHKLEVTETTRKGKLQITLGKFWAQIAKWDKGDSFVEFETPNAVAGIRGTTLWGDVKVDAICALEGTIEVTSLKAKGKKPPKPMTVKQGTCASKMAKGLTKPMKPTAKQVEKYLAEVLIKD